MVCESQISFVVQGKFNDTTIKLLKDIKRFYPNSPVILSVWDGCKVVSDNYDTLVRNADPGGFSNLNVYLNVNRQIVSSYNGLCEVNTEYCIKLRSDMRISSPKIISNLEYSNSLHREVLDNESWVTVINLTTYNINVIRKPLAICDWVFLGKTSDVKKFFAIEHYPQSYFEYFTNAPNVYGDMTSQRYSAEQWIIYSRYKELMDSKGIKFAFCFDDNNELIKFHRALLANEIRVVGISDIGLYSEKYKIYNFGMSRMLSKSEWVIEYSRYHSIKPNPLLFIDITRVFYNFISNKLLRGFCKGFLRFIR